MRSPCRSGLGSSPTGPGPKGEGVTLSSLGATYFHLNRFDDALSAFQRSTQIFQNVQDAKEKIPSMVNLVWIHATQGRLDLASKIASEALSLAREGGDKPTEAKLLYEMAYVEHKRGNPIAARSNIEAAISVAESLRSAAERRDLRSSFLADHEDFYGFKIELLMEQRLIRPRSGYDLQAFQASERARARGLYDALADEGQDIDPPVKPELLAEHDQVQREINELDQQLRRTDLSREAKASLGARLRGLLDRDERLSARMRGANGWVGGPGFLPSTSLWEIQNRILDRETVLVEYYLGEESSYAWVVTRDIFSEASRLDALIFAIWHGGSMAA